MSLDRRLLFGFGTPKRPPPPEAIVGLRTVAVNGETDLSRLLLLLSLCPMVVATGEAREESLHATGFTMYLRNVAVIAVALTKAKFPLSPSSAWP